MLSNGRMAFTMADHISQASDAGPTAAPAAGTTAAPVAGTTAAPVAGTTGPSMPAYANGAHFFSHIFMLLYPTVVLALQDGFNLPYGEMLMLSLPGFILFGAAALPAGKSVV